MPRALQLTFAGTTDSVHGWARRLKMNRSALRVRIRHLGVERALSGEDLPAARGLSTHPLRYTWRNMIHRCHNPANPAFHNYGGRGIRVCDRWRQSLEAFASDMGPRPTPKHTLERIDNDGNYEPRNCRWATRMEQMRNTRITRLITARGVTDSLSGWARVLGLNPRTLLDRLRAGRTVEELLEQIPWGAR